ncbi:MAG: TIGR04222 domain-containing membrane protein [Acidobacteria bacterium]|nr:TIGR04222 domain-containing membrane protein [Acidobacteriota bacterium]
MDWIASMPGPQFLGLYFVVIAATLAACWAALRTVSGDGPEPMVPVNPDPYQLAWLRGGDDEVARLAIIDLARRGLLHESPGRGLLGKPRVRPSKEPPPRGLAAGPRMVMEAFKQHDLPLAGMLKQAAFRDAVRSIVDPIAAQFGDSFLVSSAQRLYVFGFGALAILGLGGYKLVVALSKGRTNVGFLCLFALIGTGVLWALTRARLNSRGRLYLERAKGAYRELETRPKMEGTGLQPQELLLAVALFGAPVLLGGPDMMYASMLGEDLRRRTSGWTDTSSGSSCSSSDSGGGCGGGCGGCGGE